MFRSHPVHGWSQEERATAYGISFHGDEGQTKRGRNLLILSWSAVAVSGDTMFFKYPILVLMLTFIKSFSPFYLFRNQAI